MSPGSGVSGWISTAVPVTRCIFSLLPTGMLGLLPEENGAFHHAL
jgi:hypothetical protein